MSSVISHTRGVKATATISAKTQLSKFQGTAGQGLLVVGQPLATNGTVLMAFTCFQSCKQPSTLSPTINSSARRKTAIFIDKTTSHRIDKRTASHRISLLSSARSASCPKSPATMADSNLNEPSFDVQVILSELQDTDNPLAAATDFKGLGLSVYHRGACVMHVRTNLH